jgi:hypothetical protein
LRYNLERTMRTAATTLTGNGISAATPVELRRRIGAAVVDWAICIAAYLIVSIPLGAIEGFGFALRSVSSTDAPGRIVVALAQLAVLLPTVVYFTLGLREGHTLGMAALDFKTLDSHSGRPPGTIRSLLRSLLSAFFAVAVLAAYMGHSAERTGWSHDVMTIYVAAVVVTTIVVLDKVFIPLHRSGRALTDRLFGLVRVTGAAGDTDRGLSEWLDRRVSR